LVPVLRLAGDEDKALAAGYNGYDPRNSHTGYHQLAAGEKGGVARQQCYRVCVRRTGD